MPRKKQDQPQKHGSGTNSIMHQSRVEIMEHDQQDRPLDCTKSARIDIDQHLIDNDQSIDTGHREIDTESALDLSVRKRPCSSEASQPSADAKIPSIPPTNLDGHPFVPIYVPPFRFPPFPTFKSSGQGVTSQADALSKLSSLVHQVGKGQTPNSASATCPSTSKSLDPNTMDDGSRNSLQEALGAAAGHGLSFQELWLRFVKKEENAELKRLNEAKQIFTCLQCHASFQTMEQLVKHMETTQHYANIPKHYSWSLQYARQRMRQMKMKMKYSDKMMYYCFLCTAPFTEPVHVHFNCVHNMHNPVENMKFVHVISVNGKNTGRTASSNSSSSVPTIGQRALTTPHSTNGHHPMERRRRRSNEEEIRFSTSPLSVGASSCDSGSVSPTPSASSKRSTTCPLASFSPNSTESSDNLLLKMEKLVQSANGEKRQRKRPHETDLEH